MFASPLNTSIVCLRNSRIVIVSLVTFISCVPTCTNAGKEELIGLEGDW